MQMVMWRTMMTAPSAPGGFECPPPPYQKPKAPNVWMINDGLGSRKSINAHIYTRSQNIASTPVTLKTALSLRAVSGARVRCLTCCPGWKGTREVLHCCTDKPRIDPLIIAMSITQRRKNYSQTKLQHSLGMPFFWHGKSNHIPGTGQAVLFTTLASRTSSGDTDMVSTATRFLPILVTRWLLAGCHVSPGCFPDVPFFVAIVVTCLQVDGGARSNCTSQFFCFGKGPPCSFVSTSLSLSLSLWLGSSPSHTCVHFCVQSNSGSKGPVMLSPSTLSTHLCDACDMCMCVCTRGTDTNAEGAETRAALQTVPYFPSRQQCIQANTFSAKHSIAHVAACGDDIFPVPCGNRPLAMTPCSFTETSCR